MAHWVRPKLWDFIPGQPAGAPPDQALFRVQQALYLIINSPEFNIQK